VLGFVRARREGKKLGKPPAPALRERILAALNKLERTEGMRKIAARFGVNPSTVQNISQQLGPFEQIGPSSLPGA
jgi:hypothetical protein